MKDLAFLTSPDLSKAEVVTNHVVIAEYAGIERSSLRLLINKHKKDFEQFGKLIFEISTLPDSRGQKVKIYQLNRNQAMLMITYLDNTEVVRNFKIALVKRFDEMEKELQARKFARAVEKPNGVTLHQAISKWNHYSRHGNTWHGIIRSLLATTVTGLTKKQIQARDTDWRKEKTLLDLLNSEEMERYKMLESIVIAMIEAGSDYEPIKTAIKATMTTKKVHTGK
ncbi:Rha family transcriptional regulator [Lactococcus lactis subsp. lactis]|uniref:Rha family transcriptional regulator n=1 Tax=Lactococcus lactis TaxID=1358 RepID=UPI001C1F9658|nr:Rha family transcriptional regulator [Lactococcus lactis]MBU7531224.1 Rha family transcriptional regulator [Lactococcus lactis]